MVLPEFGFSQYCTPMWGFEEDLKHFHAAGADCVAICEAKLDPAILDQQMEALWQSGLRVSSIHPTVAAFFDVKLSRTKGNLEANRRSLYQTVEVAGRNRLGDRLNTITGVIPRLTWNEALPLVASEFRELCKRTRDHGLKVMIEPLNPVYCGLDSMISTLDEAYQLLEAVEADNLGITLDVWHVWQQDAIYDQIRQYANYIWTVHINDWKPLRCTVDRHVPGEGQIPLGKLLCALDSIGFRNGYIVEFFSDWLLPDSLWRQDMDDVLRRSRAGFERAWEG